MTVIHDGIVVANPTRHPAPHPVVLKWLQAGQNKSVDK